MRLAVDTGGTFTDLVVEDDAGSPRLFKSPTTPQQPVAGILACVDLAAEAFRTSRADLLGRCDLFIHATTRAINAILTGATARTAFVTTEGHRDILLFREGGRTRPFDHRREYPPPYVPRRLTFEIAERIAADGEVVVPLTEGATGELVRALAAADVEAVGVCLLWSVVNPEHELAIGRAIADALPEVALSLSHQLNPSVREYRRASSTCIDASLKPGMSSYLRSLAEQLEQSGFGGRLLIVSSAGGVLDAADARDAPIHSLGSGPAMAPVAGRFYAATDQVSSRSVIVTDAGGTSFDVSLVRDGAIPWTRETWLGEEYSGDITGFPSVAVKSIGAGGGSIAWVDDGGLLRVGPQSAGSEPGPACYGRGGVQATVTDACLKLGFLDPEFFLGGTIPLDPDAATSALERSVGAPLGLDAVLAASSVLTVATEQMAHAIEEVVGFRGVDPTDAAIVAGGGAAGFNIVAIAQRLGCPAVLIPAVAAGLSAAGAILSDLQTEFATTLPTITTRFESQAVNAVLDQLRERCRRFAAASGVESYEIKLFAEARYPDQVWELEVRLPVARFESEADVERLRSEFHAEHEQAFGVSDPGSPIEVVSWRGRLTGGLGEPGVPQAEDTGTDVGNGVGERRAFFPGTGWRTVPVLDAKYVAVGSVVAGPALIDSTDTTIVLYPGASARRLTSGSLAIDPNGAAC